MDGRQLGVTWVCLALMLGCSTTSNIRRVNGPSVEGDIIGGSPESIFVDTDTGSIYEIRRDDVSSIDYPGNVHANIGIGVLVYGALNIAVGLPECNERTENKVAFCTGVFLPAALGTGLVVWGLLVQHGQRAGAADMSLRPRRARPVPMPVRVPKASLSSESVAPPQQSPPQQPTPSSLPEAP